MAKKQESGKSGAGAKGSRSLDEWKELISADETAYESELALMSPREEIYRGRTSIDKLIEGDAIAETPHVRNIVAELIECQVSSTVPMPKVTALHREDEALAVLIEDMIRNKLDKLPTETINDQMERTVPIQGGAALQYDWDNTIRTHTAIGDGKLSFRHPKQIIPQAGVTSDIEDMDRITVKIPQTAEFIKRKYDVDLSGEGEEEPSLRSADDSAESVERMLTQYVVYYRNEAGGIGIYSWVNDTELENLEDYQARRLRRCKKCGAAEPAVEVDSISPTTDGSYPETAAERENPKSSKAGRDKCPYCGGSFEYSDEEYYVNPVPFELEDGTTVGNGEIIPYFKPGIYPIFLQRNVSSYGKFLGDSDVDKIKTQQNSINRLYAKAFAQLLNAGSYITLPDVVSIKKDSEEGKIIRLGNAAQKSLIDVYDMTCNISPALEMIDYIYKEAQQLIGITDSFLGRKDTTATSGRAKEFSAAQAAGRLESKRVMKNEMYARLFRAIFLFELACADEPRAVLGTDKNGNPRNEEWDKYLFLKRDEAGVLYWNTDFLFSTDSTAPLANNREAMWQEMRSHFESGAFGDPTQVSTQIVYWSQMEALHYPGAASVKNILSEEQTRQAQSQLGRAQAEKEALNYADSAAAQALSGAAPDISGAAGGQEAVPDPGLPEQVLPEMQGGEAF